MPTTPKQFKDKFNAAMQANPSFVFPVATKLGKLRALEAQASEHHLVFMLKTENGMTFVSIKKEEVADIDEHFEGRYKQFCDDKKTKLNSNNFRI